MDAFSLTGPTHTDDIFNTTGTVLVVFFCYRGGNWRLREGGLNLELWTQNCPEEQEQDSDWNNTASCLVQTGCASSASTWGWWQGGCPPSLYFSPTGIFPSLG